ncbi:hypothetical protein ACSHWO_35315 (plasmid) [Streptomyces sp. HUAS TT3]|uniref:hypothetical protein n=1 Tax=Streptomyces sp. HUAS TT3 TaxID=3447510 RepID=UPI003F65F298
MSSTSPSGLHSVELVELVELVENTMAATPDRVDSTRRSGRRTSSVRTTAPGAHHRIHSVAGFPAAGRSGLWRAVRLLVGPAPRVRCVGIVPLGVAVRAGAGVVGRLGERVLEVAQPDQQ